jgi:TatD DNase family protein
MFIDVHCHVDFYKDDEIAKIVERCKKSNVVFVNQGTRKESLEKVLALHEMYPETAKIALGIYPIDAIKLTGKELNERIDFIKKNKDKIVAIGEVGLDFHEEGDTKKTEQIENFKKFIDLSVKLKKPIIVHSRKAEGEAVEILKDMYAKKVVMHCFSGNFKLIKKIIENKWFLTIPTNVTFSEHFQKVIEMAPIEQLFCETDSPYLHPRKERNNEPSNVIESYKKIAEIKKMKLKDVEKQLEENYKGLFGYNAK